MERMTLREAAQRTGRSITTLRRYIRSSRLRAEKRFGRFGPEYFLSNEDLRDAGLAAEVPPAQRQLSAPHAAPAASVPELATNLIPLALYSELQMKHEQLLVQYGMIRAAGIRAMDLQNKLAAAEDRLKRLDLGREREDRSQNMYAEQLAQENRESHLELEGRALEIAALKEKVRGLELLTRNAATSENIESQFRNVIDQSKRVERMRTLPSFRIRPARRVDPGDA